ncbi:TPA: hypothetical protein JG832_002433 [Enterobacter hormaechei subsp. xiangfangensis]|nr:hypothetical protein [Enterobacter hormaechei subsp. xiangfangensis]HAV1890569.1 hypothetical protein [Enterobacter hormaechei subsp. xiangfangensis]
MNYTTRREALEVLEPGASILLVATPPLTLSKETANIQVTANRLGFKVSVKSMLLVAEGDVSERVLRVTRLADGD